MQNYDISLDKIYEELSSGIESTMEKALRFLEGIDDEINPDPVIECLKSSNSNILEYSAGILGKIKTKRAVKPLLALLGNDNRNVREKAVRALGRIGDKDALPALVKISEDQDDYVREAAVWAMGEIGDEGSISTLIGKIHDRDGYVSKRAMEALQGFARSSPEAVVRELLSDPEVQEARLRDILDSIIGDREEVSNILEYMNNREEYVDGTLTLRIRLKDMLNNHRGLYEGLDRRDLIRSTIENKEAVVTAAGRLATWTRPESTGRSPKDTITVKRPESQDSIDWSSPNNNPIKPEVFDMVFKDAISMLKNHDKVYITNRSVGSDSRYNLCIKTVTNNSLTALFTLNMFLPIPGDFNSSVFADKEFVLIVLPYNKLDEKKYRGLLRKLTDGSTTDMAIAIDYDRRLGVVIGSAYLGSVKKLVFTVMNYYLPAAGVLPLHCSANESPQGDTSLFLGLSGTGKTTLSADPGRLLIGDDEHGWSESGIFNFENGCYAKLINLSSEKEPEIYNAVMAKMEYTECGTIVENAMIYPDGHLDLSDARLTPNSRLSFPLTMLSNIKQPSTGSHPGTIIFLTADAYGVLPPVSKLDKNQAMLWFLMGYTSKLAGTETGIVEPVATFSRFFGEPFMPRNPNVYANMLGEKLEKYGSSVYLLNTGWTGGKYGIGERIDISLTRSMVDSALSGELDKAEYREDKLFHLNVPKACGDIPKKMLNPRTTWKDKDLYKETAEKLAKAFSDHFDKVYGDKGLDPEIIAQCPGK